MALKDTQEVIESGRMVSERDALNAILEVLLDINEKLNSAKKK